MIPTVVARRAIVIGGSIAGLLAARVLAEHFESVTVLERDQLPDGPVHRKGVPQDRQVHVGLPLGVQLIDGFFPGIGDELQGLGCPVFDEVADVATFTSEGWRVRCPSTVKMIGFTRPLFEYVIRRRLSSLENVTLRQGAAVGLLATNDRAEVCAVATKDGDALAADLVVDASGRGSRSVKWLQELGYAAPPEVHVRAFMGYTSQIVRLPEGALPDGLLGLVALPFPGRHKGGLIQPVERGTHVLTAAGMLKDYPPSDRTGLIEYLKLAPSPLLGEVASLSEPLGPPATYHMPGNQRRLWERMLAMPGRFLAVGDAVTSFNPIYGQGMTVAALEASRLRALLSEDRNLRTLPERFHSAISASVDFAFGLAAETDGAYDGAELHGYRRAESGGSDYLRQLERLATKEVGAVRALAQGLAWMDENQLYSGDLVEKIAEGAVEADRSWRHANPATVPRLHAATGV